MNVGIINYGMGNIGSVSRALLQLGAHPVVMNSPAEFESVDKVILPGVGAFAAAMANLRAGGWVEAIDEHVKRRGKPFLGICLGMQLLADESEENGATAGLGLIPGKIVSFARKNMNERIPHVGWNEVEPTDASPVFEGVPRGTDFYFVHSYIFEPANDQDIAATATYGVPFAAAVARDNVWGAQFHPEKSSKAGARLLANFLG